MYQLHGHHIKRKNEKNRRFKEQQPGRWKFEIYEDLLSRLKLQILENRRDTGGLHQNILYQMKLKRWMEMPYLCGI